MIFFIAMSIWLTISDSISKATSTRFTACRHRRVGGGCINRAYIVESEAQRYFVKLNDSNALAMFQAEAAGLRELSEAGALRVPHLICVGTAAHHSFIVTEYIEFGTQGDMAAFGRQLAALHHTCSHDFGWHMNNTLGTTPQINTRASEWCEFWRAHRLGYQLELAARNGYRGALQKKGERLMACFNGLFPNDRPKPALLHGDLWAGNYAVDLDGNAVIFDPAVYYGDREADVAMTELFGGFAEEFYRAYYDAYPLDEGYAVRKVFYNLYHILNHLNLFGGAYTTQAERMMDFVLGELSK